MTRSHVTRFLEANSSGHTDTGRQSLNVPNLYVSVCNISSDMYSFVTSNLSSVEIPRKRYWRSKLKTTLGITPDHSGESTWQPSGK